MAGLINLEVVDTPIIEQTNFGPDMQRWLPNLVDIINASFTILANSINNLITAQGIDVGGSGAGPINVSVVGLTSTGDVNARLVSSSNPVTISSVVPALNGFNITFSANPGASAIIFYQAFSAQP